MRMGDKGFYFGLRHFNFSDADFRRRMEKGGEYVSETYRTCSK